MASKRNPYFKPLSPLCLFTMRWLSANASRTPGPGATLHATATPWPPLLHDTWLSVHPATLRALRNRHLVRCIDSFEPSLSLSGVYVLTPAGKAIVRRSRRRTA